MTAINDAYLKYSTVRFPLPTASQLETLERRIGVVFPDDYREFVLQYNGGYFNAPLIAPVVDECPSESLSNLFGIGSPYPCAELGEPATLTLFDDNEPPIIVPIGGTTLGGLIILRTEPEDFGCVFLKQAFGDFYYLADGIEEFFELLSDPLPV
jgi:hypothetical protein